MDANNAKIKIVFFGTPEFAATGLQALLDNDRYEVLAVVTQPDKPAGRGARVQESPVKTLALKHDIPVLQPSNVRKESERLIARLSVLGDFDIGVVIAFGQILPEEILNFPKAGCVNVHASLLPRWRGAAPIQRAIMAGDNESGICLMKMDIGLDTGPVYSSRSVTLSPTTTAGELHDLLAKVGGELISQDLSSIAQGKMPAISQPESGVTYAQKITPTDCLINWNQDANIVERQVRGLSPFPGAFSLIEGKRLKIYSARAAKPLQPTQGPAPGKIAFVDSTRLEVECGEGNLAIEEVQIEGKRRLPIREFLKGMRLDTTIKFTDR